MLRRVLWSVMYGVLATLASLVARKVAGQLYRIVTGEPPPVKKA
jgi:hypothetical protein